MKTIEEILKECRTVAVVGVSSSPEKASHRVAAYLKSSGYRMIPVNPGESEILGERAYPDLASIPEKIDDVDLFRRAEDVLPIVERAIKICAKTVWMQLGIVNPEAAAIAERAGLSVVMDRCMMREYKHLYCSGGLPQD